jgi:hypothetical protein
MHYCLSRRLLQVRAGQTVAMEEEQRTQPHLESQLNEREEQT